MNQHPPIARSFTVTLESLRNVEGWLTPDQARVLWERSREVAPGERIVEIGSFQGRSTIVLATAAAPGVEIVAIDPHGGTDRGPQELRGHEAEARQDHEAFHANLAAHGLDEQVRHVRRFSDEALAEVEGEIALLYIDGAHRWGPASRDITRWGARVRPGGVMLIHDSFSSVGVTAAQVTELFWSSSWRFEGRTRSLSQYRRSTSTALEDRLGDLVAQLAEIPWFVRNLLVKALITVGLRRWTGCLGQPSGEWPY